MKISTKAVLWSALAFPGAGHFALRRFARGAVLLGVTVCAIWYMVHYILTSGLMDKINDLAYKILSGEVSSDMSIAAGLIDVPDPIGVQIASWLVLVCWVAGMVDSYRIGVQEDKRDQAK